MIDMELRVRAAHGGGAFRRAQAAFEREFDLDLPVDVYVRDAPDHRTWTGHDNDRHVLHMARSAAVGPMARELAIHEFAHMYRHERGHPSHRQSTAEAIFLSAAGRQVPKARITQCYQIANHMKDIYADDLTVHVSETGKLVDYLESRLARSVAPADHHASADPAIQAVNAAFAVGLVERHGLVPSDHRLFNLGQTAARAAPGVPYEEFRELFETLARDPDESEYRRCLVDAASTYLGTDQRAAD